MRSHLVSVLLGLILAIVLLGAGAYLFVWGGGVPMATSAKPLPLERMVAGLALHAAFKSSLGLKNPVTRDEAGLIAGAHVYQHNCAMCHGLPGSATSAIAKGMFPGPPQLFAADEMVADDPEGETYWKVTNGIRLSGMPGFEHSLSQTERWQVTMLVAHADKLSPAVTAALRP